MKLGQLLLDRPGSKTRGAGHQKVRGATPHPNFCEEKNLIILGVFHKKFVDSDICELGQRNSVGAYPMGVPNYIGGGHPPGGSYPLGEIFDYFRFFLTW